METVPQVSIIIVDYGDIKWLEQCLATIDYNQAQVIVIDNNKNNRGFAKANNLGASYAKGKYLLFLNNDTKLAPDFIKPMVDNMELYPHVGICAPRIIGYDGYDIEQRIGKSCDIYGWQAWEGPTFFVEGSALMIRKDLFFRLGGFDEEYFMYLEDIDLCWRAQLLGYLIDEVPESIVYHYAGGSSASSRGRKNSFVSTQHRRYHGEKNQLRTVLKNYSALTLFWVLPRYLGITLLELGYLLLTFNGDIGLQYLKAWAWNIRHFGDTMRKRKEIQRTRIVSDKSIQSLMVKHSAKIETIRRIGLPKFI